MSFFVSGGPKPVQRLAGQAATGPEQDLPFVLDDDAVAQAYEERLQEQQQAADPQDPAAQMQALRPRYGHRSPASALAGWCHPVSSPHACLNQAVCRTHHAQQSSHLIKQKEKKSYTIRRHHGSL